MSDFCNSVHEWAVILAGGDGMRLQELSFLVSGDRRPKQFCSFFGGKSLLTHTRERLQAVFHEDNTLFALNRAHEIHYSRQLPDVPSNRMLIQPSNRGTAPAIVLAVLEILRRDASATISVFPSDHHYVTPRVFYSTIDRGLYLAKKYKDRVLIIGAPATYPEVEYGWIQPGRAVVESVSHPLHLVSEFWEKPSITDARLLQERECLWNTFVAIGSVGAFVDLFVATVPDLFGAIASDLSEGALDRTYSKIKSTDFSRDVLAQAPELLLVLRDGPSGWTDLGSPRRAIDVIDAFAAS